MGKEEICLQNHLETNTAKGSNCKLEGDSWYEVFLFLGILLLSFLLILITYAIFIGIYPSQKELTK